MIDERLINTFAPLSIHHCETTGLDLPVPQGWVTSEKSNPLYSTCLISPEAHSRTGVCFTSLTVNVCREYSKKYDLSESIFSDLALQDQNINPQFLRLPSSSLILSDSAAVASIHTSNESARLIEWTREDRIVRVVYVKPEWPTFVSAEFISSFKTDTLYSLFFVTPLTYYNADWRLAARMFREIAQRNSSKMVHGSNSLHQ